MNAHDVLIEHHVIQAFQANEKHQNSDIYVVGDHIYLSTQNLTLPKGRVRKLVQHYIGPYHVSEAHNETSMVALEFQVRWTLGDMTWELILACQELEALDIYLELWAVAKPCNLPK